MIACAPGREWRQRQDTIMAVRDLDPSATLIGMCVDYRGWLRPRYEPSTGVQLEMVALAHAGCWRLKDGMHSAATGRAGQGRTWSMLWMLLQPSPS
ncbi:hypothetical protein FALCPG4_002821 [Fusarium falciforme]